MQCMQNKFWGLAQDLLQRIPQGFRRGDLRGRAPHQPQHARELSPAFARGTCNWNMQSAQQLASKRLEQAIAKLQGTAIASRLNGEASL